MGWIESISDAIEYIEEHIREELSVEAIAKQAALSPFYFQRGFSMLCGLTVGEYIRQRRLSLAGLDVVMTDRKIIDLALDYGYDSPDSFTRAFTRFHGITPAALRKGGGAVRSFAPLKIRISLEGGKKMDCRITKKDAFTVMGTSRRFQYEGAKQEVPAFWKEHYEKGGGRYVRGMYGVSIDETMGGNEFEYLIADNYNPVMDVPEGYTTMAIPAFTWAVFPCRGKLPDTFQAVNEQVFSEWLPGNRGYEIAAGICIEMDDDPRKYEKGTQDKNYYSEMWIPVKKK